MAKEVLRTVQPAHKSDRVTVAKAKRAWIKVESRSKGVPGKQGSPSQSSGRGSARGR